MLGVKPRTTFWAPSRLHGALRVQPLVALAVADAYSVIWVLADAAGARATRLPAPNAAAVAVARTDISLVLRAWVIDEVPLGFRGDRRCGATSSDPVAVSGVGLPDAVRRPGGVINNFLYDL
jgi:hypothetical protein